MMVPVIAVVFLLGLVVGSFNNVVIHRVPSGASLRTPGSHCPHCEKPIRWRHNVPVVSWVLLRGRCADCGVRIGARYPVVEVATGVLFAILALRLEALDLLTALPAYLYFAAIGVALTAIDLAVRRLPNAIVLPSYVIIGLLLASSAAIQNDWWSLARAGIGAAALFGFYFLLAFIYPAGMGFGDVKLAGVIGAVLAYLSWATLVLGAFAGFLIGALAGIALMVVGRAGRKTAVPFGPSMLAGALLAILAADVLVQSYLDFLYGTYS